MTSTTVGVISSTSLELAVDERVEEGNKNEIKWNRWTGPSGDGPWTRPPFPARFPPTHQDTDDARAIVAAPSPARMLRNDVSAENI